MFEAPPDAPQSAGDLIGRAFRVYRRHVPLFFKALIAPTILSTLGALGLQWSVTYGITTGETIEANINWAALSAVVLASFLVILAAKWILTIRQLAFVRLFNGYDDSYDQAVKVASQRKWVVLGLYFLIGFAGTTAIVLPLALMVAVLGVVQLAGALRAALSLVALAAGTLGMVSALTAVTLVGFLVFSVVACEEQTPSGFIQRAVTLTFADLWRSCGFGTLLFVTVTALSYPLALPIVVISGIDVFQQGLSASETLMESYRMPIYLMVVSQVWESLINMILWPGIFIAYGYFYYDLRLRQEGLDLSRRLTTLQEDPA